MKKLSIILAVLFFGMTNVQAQKITPEEAANHIGETVTVCGKIFGGKYFDRSEKKITLLNMGAAYPKSPLTIVVNEEHRKNFKTVPEELYNNKTVCIKGVVKEFKGKPQIFIQSEEDVTVE